MCFGSYFYISNTEYVFQLKCWKNGLKKYSGNPVLIPFRMNFQGLFFVLTEKLTEKNLGCCLSQNLFTPKKGQKGHFGPKNEGFPNI